MTLKKQKVCTEKQKKGTLIKNKDTVVLQDCVLLYPKNIRLKLRNNHEVTPTEGNTMVGLHLQYMYPANATEMSPIVHMATEEEKKWLVEKPEGLQRWLQNKGVVNTYVQPRVYRLQD